MVQWTYLDTDLVSCPEYFLPSGKIVWYASCMLGIHCTMYIAVYGCCSQLFSYQQSSCVAHTFRSDGNSTGLFTPCLQLQTDSGNRNNQWLSVLPVEYTSPLSVFFAWLNLDFGIETCFYNGMDPYSQTWLQFIFPAYVYICWKRGCCWKRAWE